MLLPLARYNILLWCTIEDELRVVDDFVGSGAAPQTMITWWPK